VPWPARSRARTCQPRAASAGPVCHHVAAEDITPCSNRIRPRAGCWDSLAPATRQHRTTRPPGPGAVKRSAILSVTHPRTRRRWRKERSWQRQMRSSARACSRSNSNPATARGWRWRRRGTLVPRGRRDPARQPSRVTTTTGQWAFATQVRASGPISGQAASRPTTSWPASADSQSRTCSSRPLRTTRSALALRRWGRTVSTSSLSFYSSGASSRAGGAYEVRRQGPGLPGGVPRPAPRWPARHLRRRPLPPALGRPHFGHGPVDRVHSRRPHRGRLRTAPEQRRLRRRQHRGHERLRSPRARGARRRPLPRTSTQTSTSRPPSPSSTA
jgi:hypothetical protein